jgi:hypothetical protein
LEKINALYFSAQNTAQREPEKYSFDEYAKRKYREGYMFLAFIFLTPLLYIGYQLIGYFLDSYFQ